MLLLGVGFWVGCEVDQETTTKHVQPVSGDLRAEFDLAPFYEKGLILGSFPVVGKGPMVSPSLV